MRSGLIILCLGSALGVLVLQQLGPLGFEQEVGRSSENWGVDRHQVQDSPGKVSDGQLQSQVTNWLPIINSNGFYQGVDFLSDPHELRVFNKEWNFSTEDWDYSNYSITSSFEIRSIAAAGLSDDFYVLGKSVRNGAAIIEHWSVDPPEGSTMASRQQHFVPLAVAAPVSPVSVAVQGGTYEPPDTRPLGGGVARKEIYVGSSIGNPLGLAPDPNGRYLLVLGSNGSVYQIDMVSLADPVEVFTVGQIPELWNMSTIDPRHHPSFGMCFVLTSDLSGNPVEDVVVIYDYDNDGILDHGQAFTTDDYYDQHEGQGEWWLDDFINYYD